MPESVEKSTDADVMDWTVNPGVECTSGPPLLDVAVASDATVAVAAVVAVVAVVAVISAVSGGVPVGESPRFERAGARSTSR
jgi:hypothetical protein